MLGTVQDASAACVVRCVTDQRPGVTVR
jgi:hypothetical protein